MGFSSPAKTRSCTGDHAILNGREPSERVNRVLTFGGQSLKGPLGSVMLKLAETATDWADQGGLCCRAGTRHCLYLWQGPGRRDGRSGRTVSRGRDIPPMGMNVPNCDNRQLALNIMHWLSV